MNANYLKGLIFEKGYKLKDVSKILNLSYQSFFRKLYRKGNFTQEEIKKLIELLEIPDEEITKYFFS